jgi:hypothetical protein
VDVGNQEIKIYPYLSQSFKKTPVILDAGVCLSISKWKELGLSFPNLRRVTDRKL